MRGLSFLAYKLLIPARVHKVLATTLDSNVIFLSRLCATIRATPADLKRKKISGEASQIVHLQQLNHFSMSDGCQKRTKMNG